MIQSTQVLWLVRHGESTWNTLGLAQGHCDQARLTRLGQRQAWDVASQLRDRPVGALFSSDLRRALETAAPLAEVTGLAVTRDDEYGEHLQRGIEIGAEDYLTKPFNPLMLQARINASLEATGFNTTLAHTLDEARQVIRREPAPDCIVVTGGLHESGAAQLLGLARDRSISTLGLVEQTDPDAKGLARRLGLTGYLSKPADPAEVTATVRRLIDRRKLQQRTGIIGESPAIQEVLVKAPARSWWRAPSTTCRRGAPNHSSR